MTDQPLLSNGQLIAYAATIIGTLGTVIAVLFWQYKSSKDEYIEWLQQQLTELRKTFADEAREDRLVLEKFRDTLREMAEPRARGPR